MKSIKIEGTSSQGTTHSLFGGIHGINTWQRAGYIPGGAASHRPGCALLPGALRPAGAGLARTSVALGRRSPLLVPFPIVFHPTLSASGKLSETHRWNHISWFQLVAPHPVVHTPVDALTDFLGTRLNQIKRFKDNIQQQTRAHTSAQKN
jgi:hypothetical protein